MRSTPARHLTGRGALIRSWNLQSLVSRDLFKCVIIIITIIIIIIIIIIMKYVSICFYT